jgi:FlaA1/EpsC-like NDP-sugar epimerase
MVRLVNVVGARGGVIESFAREIAAKRPVRITDARMTRYWITVPEAMYLILSAGCRNSTADTLLLNCGDAVGIPDVAKRIWELLREPGQNSGKLEIEYTGIRPGERLAEELCYNSETLRPTSTTNILEAARDEMSFDRDFALLANKVMELRSLAESARVDDLKEYLFGLVADYK